MVKHLIYLLFFSFLFFPDAFAQPANDLCGNATTLTSGAAPLCNQTTDGGGTTLTETTNAGTVGAANNFNQTVWYRFCATSTNMFVEWEFTGLVSGATWCPGNVSMVVYNSTSCQPAAASIIATESAAADGAIVMTLTGLTVGNCYLVQVGYNDGAGCKIPIFCMRVGNTPSSCSCTSPCTAGCGYSTTPSVATVTSTCPEYVLTPIGDGGSTNTYCYTFIANNSNISFNMIITSNCSGGNVSAFTWNLQTSACGASVASGTLASLSVTGLTVGTSYTLCYTYTIPTTCNHSSVYPYFVGASPLPIELLYFKAEPFENRTVNLSWATASEINSELFLIERSVDGVDFEIIDEVRASYNSSELITYSYRDNQPLSGISYYRLSMRDRDGKTETSRIYPVEINVKSDFEISLYPNPVNESDPAGGVLFGAIHSDFKVYLMDISGKIIEELHFESNESAKTEFRFKSILKSGIYIVKAIDSNGNEITDKLVIK